MNVNSAIGGIVGALVGDAVGVPYEFNPPQNIPSFDHIEPTPPSWFTRSHSGTPVGTWSDDGALLLALLEAGIHGSNDSDTCIRFGEHLVEWYVNGRFTPDGRVYDVGGTTVAAINAIRAGKSPLTAGKDDEYSNGNGSLMRSLPVAVLKARTGGDEDIQLAMRQSGVTHRHPLSQVCCAVYVRWLRYLAALPPHPEGSAVGDDLAFRAALRDVKLYIRRLKLSWHAPELKVLKRAFNAPTRTPSPKGKLNGSGYVLDSLLTAQWCVSRTASFKDCVRMAISFGNDTDTTACIAGGAAGVRYGLEGIPSPWQDAMQGKSVVAPLLAGVIGLLPEHKLELDWGGVEP